MQVNELGSSVIVEIYQCKEASINDGMGLQITYKYGIGTYMNLLRMNHSALALGLTRVIAKDRDLSSSRACITSHGPTTLEKRQGNESLGIAMAAKKCSR